MAIAIGLQNCSIFNEKDWRQGLELLRLVTTRMEHFPTDATFRDELPAELVAYFDAFLKGSLGPNNRISLNPQNASGLGYESGPKG